MSNQLIRAFLFFFVLVASGCGSGNSNFVTDGSGGGNSGAQLLNARFSGDYFAVGTSALVDPIDGPGREASFSGSLVFDGNGGISPGSGISIVQHDRVVTAIHAGGRYQIDATGAFMATISTILGPIQVTSGQTRGDAGATSGFGVGTFSMDNGDTNGRVLVVQRQGGNTAATLRGAYSFNGINSSASNTRGVFRGTLNFDGAGLVTGTYFDNPLGVELALPSPFTIGAGSTYTVADDGTFTASLNIGAASPLLWSGAVGTQNNIIFTNRLADETAGSGIARPDPTNINARSILAQEDSSQNIAFDDWTVTTSVVIKTEDCKLVVTSAETGTTVKSGVNIDSEGAVSGTTTSGNLSVDNEGNVTGDVTINGSKFTITSGKRNSDLSMSLTGTFSNPSGDDVEGTIEFTRSPAEIDPSPSPSPTTTPTPTSINLDTTLPAALPQNTALPLTVQILDQDNEVLTGDTSQVTVSLLQPDPAPVPPGVLSGTLTQTAVDGVVTFPGLQIDQPSDGYRLQFASAGLPTITSDPFNVNPFVAEATTMRFVSQPQTTTVGTVLAPAVTIEILDQLGLRFDDDTTMVTVSLPASPGALGGTLTATATDGLVTFDTLQVSVADTGYTLQVDGGSLPQINSTAFDIELQVPTSLDFSSQPVNTPPFTILNVPVVVDVLDQNGNLMTSDNSSVVDITLIQPVPPPMFPGGISGTTSQTVVNGQATFDDLQFSTQAMGYSLQAEVTATPALGTADSDPFNITANTTTPLFVGDQTNDVLARPFTAGLEIVSLANRLNTELGNRPVDLFNYQGRFIYVATATDGVGNSELLVIDANDGSLDQTLTLGSDLNNTFDLAVSGDQQTLFVTDFVNGELRTYGINGANGLLTQFDPATGLDGAGALSFVGSPGGFGGPLDLAFDSFNNQIITANGDFTTDIMVYNPGTRIVDQPPAGKIAISHPVREVALSANFAYMVSNDSDEILRFDITPGAFVEFPTVAAPGTPGSLLLDPGFQFLYVAKAAGIQTFSFDFGTGALTDLGTVAVGDGGPRNMTFAFIPEGTPGFPGGGNAIVATTDSGLTYLPLDNGTRTPLAGTLYPGQNGNPANSFDNPGPIAK